MSFVYFVDDTDKKYYFDNLYDAKKILLDIYKLRLDTYINNFGDDLGYFDAEIWICICDKITRKILEYLILDIKEIKEVQTLTVSNIHEKLKSIHVHNINNVTNINHLKK